MNLCHKFVSEVNFGYGASNALVASTRGHCCRQPWSTTYTGPLHEIYLCYFLFYIFVRRTLALRAITYEKKTHTFKCGRYVNFAFAKIFTIIKK